MSKRRNRWLKIALLIGLILLLATPTFTRPITMKEVAAAVWIFMLIGAFILSLQLFPAVILFLSFIGLACWAFFRKVKVEPDKGQKRES